MTQTSPTTIEIFPAELFFELSKYFEGIEFYKIFKDLNQRINSILRQIPVHINITDADVYNHYVKQNLISFISLQSVRSLHVRLEYEHISIFEEFPLWSFSNLRSLMIDMESVSYQVIDHILALNHLQWLCIRSFTDDVNHSRALNRFLGSLFFDSSNVNPLRSTLKTFSLQTNVSFDAFSSLHGNVETQIQTMIFGDADDSQALFQIVPSLPFVHTLEIHNFRPNPLSMIEPTFQLNHCTQLHFILVPYSIEIPTENPLLVLLQCIPNIEKLYIETSKQFDLPIILDELFTAMANYCKKLKIFELYCGSDFISVDDLIEKCEQVFGPPEVIAVVRGEGTSYKYNHIKARFLT